MIFIKVLLKDLIDFMLLCLKMDDDVKIIEVLVRDDAFYAALETSESLVVYLMRYLEFIMVKLDGVVCGDVMVYDFLFDVYIK